MAIGKQVESNQKACLEMAQNEFAAAQSRVRDLDSKLNMLLVLLSALIVGIGTVASKWYEGISCLVFTLVVISMALMIGAVITILIGALPKSYYSLDTNWLTDKKKHNCDSDSFYKDYLNAYKSCIDMLDGVCARKALTVRISTCLLAAAFILLMVIILILL